MQSFIYSSIHSAIHPFIHISLHSLIHSYFAASLEKHVNKLEDKYKSDLLKTVYAGVNKKDVDDPDMQAFFKYKCWV